MVSPVAFSFDAYSPKEIAARVDAVCMAKASTPLLSLVMLGLLAVLPFVQSAQAAPWHGERQREIRRDIRDNHRDLRDARRDGDWQRVRQEKRELRRDYRQLNRNRNGFNGYGNGYGNGYRHGWYNGRYYR